MPNKHSSPLCVKQHSWNKPSSSLAGSFILVCVHHKTVSEFPSTACCIMQMGSKRSLLKTGLCIPDDLVQTSSSCSPNKVPDDRMAGGPLAFYRMLPLPLSPISKAFIMAVGSNLKLTNAGTLNFCLLLYWSPLDKIAESK